MLRAKYTIAAFAAALSCAGAVGLLDELADHPVQLRRGLTIRKIEISGPRRIAAYIAKIDLATPGIAFVQTGRADAWGRPIHDATNRTLTAETECETTIDFMERMRRAGKNVEIAVNTASWAPYPPPKGCRYADPQGWCVTDGVEVSAPDPVRGVFVVHKDGTCQIGSSSALFDSGDVLFASSGFGLIMTNGVNAAEGGYNPPKPNPRTALGLSRDGKTLVVLVVDGRQEGYSMGAEIDDLCAIFRAEGVVDAVNMDGGGSSSLVVNDPASGKPLMLNRHKRRRTRRVAVNLGIVFPPDDVREIERTASVFHSYEFKDVADTPPPEGFKAFYISHYGRHGSRRLTKPSFPDAIGLLEKYPRTDEGEKLLSALRRIDAAQEGMDGELALRGAEEQRRLARRMAARFPEVFAGDRRLRAISSAKSRVLASMQNFMLSLQQSAPALSFDFATGEKHYRTVLPIHWEKDPETIKRRTAAVARLESATVPADAIAARFFQIDIPEKADFARSLFQYASICQCLERETGGVDIYGFLTPDEIESLSRVLMACHYAGMGNSPEFGAAPRKAARRLVRDIVERAGEAVADDRIAADLRFGHDSGLWPLAGLFGMNGPGDSVPFAEAAEKCPGWKWMPMAANLQIVFYKNDEGEILVKFLWNEEETLLRGIEPFAGPYYRWEDVKSLAV